MLRLGLWVEGVVGVRVCQVNKLNIIIWCCSLNNVEHCVASVSKQWTVALNCYVAKALQVKYEITAHRLCMAYSYKNEVCNC